MSCVTVYTSMYSLENMNMSTSVSRQISSANDEEEENFLHIYKLVVGIGTEAVRDTFDRLFLPSSLVATLKKEEMNIRRLGKKKRLTAKQIDILFPSSGTTSSKLYDISIMVCLIRNLVPVSRPINGFDTLPLTTETSMEADLARIKYYRNEVAHADSDKITTIDFQTKWQDLVDAIIRRGGTKYKNVCDELEQEKLSKNCITDLRQQIAKLQEETRDSIQQLRQDTDNKIETEAGKMDEMLQDTKTEIIVKLEELEGQEIKLVTNMTKIDITQQKLKERVLGLEGEKIESNKRLFEVKMEQDSLRSKLDESKIQNLDVGIKIKEIKTDQQELQKQIGILHAKQYMAAESDIAGREEVRGIKAEIKEDKKHIISKLERLELEQEDPVPRNIREVEEEEEEEKRYQRKILITLPDNDSDAASNTEYDANILNTQEDIPPQGRPCPPLEPRIENNEIRENPPRAETPIDDEENHRTPIEETPSDNEGNTTEQKSKKQKKSCRLRDDQEEAEVLEWVEEHPILWNKKHKEYKNKSVKDRIWQDKADEIDTDGMFYL
ncbi:unnamed protein product [Mytilus edulis]|uniref:MADF domain-containing protein n=1 Tax=Mytilus edulis TaxID=6550 RepID=A0A8S3TKT2_MYTED|nr:unnamed protein product [Mytilus edulis]